VNRMPRTWVTWITGLLAGEDRCRYAAWYKSWHQKYRKRPRPDGDDNTLSRWKAEHAEALEARGRALASVGSVQVHLEGQNKFDVKGETGTLACGPDLVYVSEDGASVVEDLKTGQRKDAHYWQVVIYMLFLPGLHPAVPKGAPLAGRLVYDDGTRWIPPEDADDAALRKVGTLMRAINSREPPPAAPSPAECQWCNIADCPHRDEPPVPEGETKAW